MRILLEYCDQFSGQIIRNTQLFVKGVLQLCKQRRRNNELVRDENFSYYISAETPCGRCAH